MPMGSGLVLPHESLYHSRHQRSADCYEQVGDKFLVGIHCQQGAVDGGNQTAAFYVCYCLGQHCHVRKLGKPVDFCFQTGVMAAESGDYKYVFVLCLVGKPVDGFRAQFC